MFNASLFVLFVVILDIKWAQALPKKMDIVVGSRNTQNGNEVHIGQAPTEVNSTEGFKSVYGSVTDQNARKYVIFGRVNKTQILMPESSDLNRIPRYFVESIDGPSEHVNVMIPARQRAVERKLQSLNELCQRLKEKMYQLLYRGKNVLTIANIIYDIISTEVQLQNQQNLLCEFNMVMPVNRSKQDTFDGNLKIIELEIEQLVVRSLAVAVPTN